MSKIMENLSNFRDLQQAAQAANYNIEPWEVERTDQEILAGVQVPVASDDPYDPAISPIRQISAAAPGNLPQVPRCYGPIRILKVLETKLNVHQRKQAMAQADLEDGERKTRILVTAFGERTPLVESLEVGGVYELRGLEKRIKLLNGDKIPSLYLNLM
jgi:hypothetical protein